MQRPFARSLPVVVLLAATVSVVPAFAEVQLLGTGAIPGNVTDNSGLNRLLEDGVTPDNLVGGLGSAISYMGVGDYYLATPDRGPADGTTTYTDRAYVVKVDVRKNAAGQYIVTPRVVDTRILKLAHRTPFTGSAAAFDPTNSPSSRRFDPEGVRAAKCGGTFYVSDEYGPFLYEFQASGKRERVLELPTKFLIDLPSATPTDELTKNLAGRQANRGMEGLAISPDGSKLYGMMQSALLQDGALDAANSRVGTNNRIVELDVVTGAVREFLYQLDSRSNGVSEILAVNDHEFLVLERDGRVGSSAVTKKIFRIDITDATDIRDLKQLPETGTPTNVIPVTKALFIDLLDPAFGLAGPNLPEKFEGMGFGPDLGDGRHRLIVTTDNDFMQTQSSFFYVFAISSSDLPEYEAQAIRRGSCGAPDSDGLAPGSR
jgi:hypothetical protein